MNNPLAVNRMGRSIFMNSAGMMFLSFMLAFFFFSSCGKRKTVLPPPPPPPPPTVQLEPEIKLIITPAVIRVGESATLLWETKNAEIVTIDGGIGSVGPQGSRRISPTTSTVYTATAQGAGKTATSKAEIKVQEKAVSPPPSVVEKETNITIEELFTSKIKDVFFEYDKYGRRSHFYDGTI